MIFIYPFSKHLMDFCYVPEENKQNKTDVLHVSCALMKQNKARQWAREG